jgi:hypothetical protein
MRPDLIPAMQPNTNPKTERRTIKVKSGLLFVKRKTLMAPDHNEKGTDVNENQSHRWPRNN